MGSKRHHRFNQEGREAEGGQRSRATRISGVEGKSIKRVEEKAIKGVEEKAIKGVQEKAIKGVQEKAIKRIEKKNLTTIMIQISRPHAGKGLTVLTEKK